MGRKPCVNKEGKMKWNFMYSSWLIFGFVTGSYSWLCLNFIKCIWTLYCLIGMWNTLNSKFTRLPCLPFEFETAGLEEKMEGICNFFASNSNRKRWWAIILLSKLIQLRKLCLRCTGRKPLLLPSSDHGRNAQELRDWWPSQAALPIRKP